MADTDSRFKSLIQPIKDIASNWDIDIAESLTEYLDELESVRISMDGGKTNLNFAEAALLIQGSTHVYSKKVEYLYQLVLKSLEFITNKKSSSLLGQQQERGKSSSGTAGGNSSMDDDEILLFDRDPSFLLLDNIVEEGDNIDLKASESTSANGRVSFHSMSHSGTENNASRVSMSLMHSLLAENHGPTSLKLSSSFLDSSGALHLCGAAPPQDAQQRALQSLYNDQSKFSANDRSMQQLQQQQQQHASPHAVYNDHIDDIIDDGGDGYWDGDGFGAQDHAPVGATAADTATVHSIRTPSKEATHQSMNSAVCSNAHTAPLAPVRNMYAMLDPHQITSSSKAVRRGKTYKVPASLLESSNAPAVPPSIDIRDLLIGDKSSLLSSQIDPTRVLLSEGLYPMKGLFDNSLLPILQKRRKLMKQERMHQLQGQVRLAKTSATTRASVLETESLHSSRVEDMWARDYGDAEDNNNNVNDNYNYYNGGGGDNNDEFDFDDYRQSTIDNNNNMTSNGAPQDGERVGGDVRDEDNENYEDLDWNEEDDLKRRVANVLNEDLNKSNRTTYEQICQKYIENFNQGADSFARETQLSKRVSEWTQRLEPILQQQEEAAQFDIHEYCDNLIIEVDEVIMHHRLSIGGTGSKDKPKETDNNTPQETESDGDEAEEVEFAEVAAGRASSEVCRIFLACLQLVNQGSLSISKDTNVSARVGGGDSALSVYEHPFKIRLNSNHKKSSALDMAEFRAPSLVAGSSVQESDDQQQYINNTRMNEQSDNTENTHSHAQVPTNKKKGKKKGSKTALQQRHNSTVVDIGSQSEAATGLLLTI